jgi:hypothetical protein
MKENGIISFIHYIFSSVAFPGIPEGDASIDYLRSFVEFARESNWQAPPPANGYATAEASPVKRISRRSTKPSLR